MPGACRLTRADFGLCGRPDSGPRGRCRARTARRPRVRSGPRRERAELFRTGSTCIAANAVAPVVADVSHAAGFDAG
jgi:hypothetical protein